MSNLADAMRPVLASAVLRGMADPAFADRIPAARRAAGIADEVIEAVRTDPALRHAVNAEPWYRSRVTLGAILSALAPILGLFGIALGPEHQDLIVTLIVAAGGVVGPALTLWGRWAARAPLGEAR